MHDAGSVVAALMGIVVIACGPTVEVASTADTDVDSSGSTTAEPGTDVVTGDLDGDNGWSEGVHLLVMSIALQPDTPLQATATITLPSPDVLALEFRWLSLDAGSTTEPRQEVGEPIEWITGVAPDGSFELALGQLVVPGNANPITGSEMTVVPTLTGTFLASGGACGELTGQIVAPLTADLMGSTFAALLLDPPEPLPLPEPHGCEP